MLNFIPEYKTLSEVLKDHKLAALGDAYVNFLFSLAQSKKSQEPVGARVDNNLLALALRKAGLRALLPSRTDRHEQADAVEALLVYAWIGDLVTIEEAVNLIEQEEDMVEAFCSLILTAKNRLSLQR